MAKNKVTAARNAALKIMRAIRSGELADRAFARQAGTLPTRDVAWLHELVYGTLRLRGRIDAVLNRYLKKGIASLDDDVLDVLRLATYQLLAMNSVPAYAAVSQAVDMTKTLKQKSASGLVNGVLQSVQRGMRGANAGTKGTAKPTLKRLSTWGSHPEWLVERWIARFGAPDTARLIEANNTRPDLYVRPVGITIEDAITKATEAGLILEKVAHAPDALRVVEGSVHDVLAAVPAIVQDPAAGLIARYAAPAHGVVADLCAAPGGKSIALADMMRDRGRVIAGDVSGSRLQRAQENARRIGTLPLDFVVADARDPVVCAADLVLIDAPCTGTGTFRRHPDGKWRIQPSDLHALVQLQRELLESASGIVKVGGLLVYSTCSLEPEENQEQVTAFLDAHPNFLRRPPSSWDDASMVDEVGNLIVLPQHSGFDGSFAVRMERVA